MDEGTAVLFGLDSFRVVDVARVADEGVQVVIETVGFEPGCTEAVAVMWGEWGRGCCLTWDDGSCLEAVS